jgi:hypothetical protein
LSSARKQEGQNVMKRTSEQLPPGSLIDKLQRVDSGKIEPKKPVPTTDEQEFFNELQLLFPKKYKTKQGKLVTSSLSSTNYQKAKYEDKVKKKINFHVIVKHTKLYEALKFVDQQNKIENTR